MHRKIAVSPPFSLADTCAPVVWASGRSANQDWIDGQLIWVGWENERVVQRQVTHEEGSSELLIDGDADSELDKRWAGRTLGTQRSMPALRDPILQEIARRHPGLRPHASGSLYEGVVDSIVGQSITVLAAAVVSARLASYFHPGIQVQERIFWPSPRAEHLANADPARLRRTGVTWKRAEALVAAGQAALDGLLDEATAHSSDDLRAMLRRLPLVGPWTVESALLWGIGDDNAFPMGDVALLRAARRAYGLPEMTMKEMQARSNDWIGHRAWASRLLWIDLFGGASRPNYSVR